MSQPKKIPKFADPWGFRGVARARAEPSADFRGRPLQPNFYRRGGVVAVALSVDVDAVADEPRDSDLSAWAARYRSAVLARYRNAGTFTETELRTAEALWLDGIGLRSLARRERVSPAAISMRVAGMARKAPEFAAWWRARNRRLGRSGRT